MATVDKVSSKELPPSVTVDFVVKNPDLVKENAQKRGIAVDVDGIVAQATERKRLLSRLNELREESNKLAQTKGKPSPEQIEKGKEIRSQIQSVESEFEPIEKKLDELFSRVPNFLDPQVPIGPESANKIVKTVGEPQQFSFKAKEHHELALPLDLLDTERGAKVAGHGFVYVKRELFMMRQVLALLMTQYLTKQGFIPMSTPVVTGQRTLYGTGYKPWALKDQYELTDTDGLSLIGTSEQTLVAQHMDEIIPFEQFPLLYCADTQCFRTEAGSHGRDTKGMLRVHQFGKVEQIIFCAPEESEYWHERALQNEEWLAQQLKIPYRVMMMASQDIAAPGYKKYDIEIWLPGQNQYRELTSNTNLTDFQTRRLNIRYTDPKSGKKVFPHTISATGFSDRVLIGILENYQREDGSVGIPEFLQPLMGGLTEIKR